jgi:anti-sigma regulatory factor (Ser/Thr protein kinase)
VLIAIEEAVQNVIRHGYQPEELPGRLEVTAWCEGGDLVLKVRDYAQPADLAHIRPRAWDPARPGGLGLHLIQAAMDEVHYTHAPDGEGNILLMRKHLG